MRTKVHDLTAGQATPPLLLLVCCSTSFLFRRARATRAVVILIQRISVKRAIHLFWVESHHTEFRCVGHSSRFLTRFRTPVLASPISAGFARTTDQLSGSDRMGSDRMSIPLEETRQRSLITESGDSCRPAEPVFTENQDTDSSSRGRSLGNRNRKG